MKLEIALVSPRNYFYARGGYMKTRFLTCSRKPGFGIIPKTRFQNTPQNPIFRPMNCGQKKLLSVAWLLAGLPALVRLYSSTLLVVRCYEALRSLLVWVVLVLFE